MAEPEYDDMDPVEAMQAGFVRLLKATAAATAAGYTKDAVIEVFRAESMVDWLTGGSGVGCALTSAFEELRD